MENLTVRLATVQAQLHAPKGQRNDFSNFNYRSCEDILKAVKPLLDGLLITITDDIKVFGDRFYVMATATITDGTESISTNGFAREQLTAKGKDESQITGSTSSYARKYALNGLLLIDDNKDADTRDNTNAEQERKDAAATAKEEARQEALGNAVQALSGSIKVIKQGIAEDDLSTASEAWFELTNDEKTSIWVAPTKGGPFSTKERTTMQSAEFRLAREGTTE